MADHPAGITVLCQDIRKTAAGGASRSFGQFALRGVTVVNGAQTVASIAETARRTRPALNRRRCGSG